MSAVTDRVAKAVKQDVADAKAERAEVIESMLGVMGSGTTKTHATAIAPAHWTPESVLRHLGYTV